MKKYLVFLALGCLVAPTLTVRAQTIMPGETPEENPESPAAPTPVDVPLPSAPAPESSPMAAEPSVPAPANTPATPATPAPNIPVAQPAQGGGLPRISIPDIKPTQKIEEPYSEDAFGVVISGSLKAKQQQDAAAVTYKRSLKNIVASLAIQGYSPNREAIINSMIFKVGNKFIVSYSDEQYILEVKSVSPKGIIFGWDKDANTNKFDFPDMAMPEKVSDTEDMNLINEKKPTIVIDESPKNTKK
jgi:hypothetical protein